MQPEFTAFFSANICNLWESSFTKNIQWTSLNAAGWYMHASMQPTKFTERLAHGIYIYILYIYLKVTSLKKCFLMIFQVAMLPTVFFKYPGRFTIHTVGQCNIRYIKKYYLHLKKRSRFSFLTRITHGLVFGKKGKPNKSSCRWWQHCKLNLARNTISTSSAFSHLFTLNWCCAAQ